MLSMLTDRFTLLESRRRDISARHRTMRAVIDSGVDLLAPDLKTLFHRLSVFQGGWTLEAASFVCQRPDVLHSMGALVDQSLIVADSSDSDSYRFRMLDTLRDYAAEHLPSADAAEAANLHAEFFSTLASQAHLGLTGPDQAVWLDRLSLDFANIAAAFRWFLEHDLTESALDLCSSLVPYWEFVGGAQVGIDWLESALQKAEVMPDVAAIAIARAKTSLARLIWLHGGFERAAALHPSCLQMWRGIDCSRGIALAQLNIQMEAHRQRDYQRSLALLEDNLKRARESEDHDMIERTLIGMGNTYVELQSFDEARTHYESSLKWSRQYGNRRRIGISLNNLGNLAILSGQYTLARHNLTQALQEFQDLHAKPLTIETLTLLGRLERLEGNLSAARTCLEQAWQLNPEEPYQIQVILLEIAKCSYESGKALEAATLFGFVAEFKEATGALNYDIEKSTLDQFEMSLKASLSKSEYAEAQSLGRTLDLGQAAQLAAL